jgi:hypothetical protein
MICIDAPLRFWVIADSLPGESKQYAMRRGRPKAVNPRENSAATLIANCNNAATAVARCDDRGVCSA